MEISRCARASLSACVPEEDGADLERDTLALGFGLLRGLLNERETFLVLARLAHLAFFSFFLPAATVVVLLPALGEAENVNAICLVDVLDVLNVRFFLAISISQKNTVPYKSTQQQLIKTHWAGKLLPILAGLIAHLHVHAYA